MHLSEKAEAKWVCMKPVRAVKLEPNKYIDILNGNNKFPSVRPGLSEFTLG